MELILQEKNIFITCFLQTRKRKPKGSKDPNTNNNGISNNMPQNTANIKLEHGMNPIKLEHSPIGKFFFAYTHK